MTPKQWIIAAALLGTGYVLYRTVAGAKELVTKTLNPASDQNAAYQAVDALGDAIDSDSTASPGTRLYDATHADGPSVPFMGLDIAIPFAGPIKDWWQDSKSEKDPYQTPDFNPNAPKPAIDL